MRNTGFLALTKASCHSLKPTTSKKNISSATRWETRSKKPGTSPHSPHSFFLVHLLVEIHETYFTQKTHTHTYTRAHKGATGPAGPRTAAGCKELTRGAIGHRPKGEALAKPLETQQNELVPSYCLASSSFLFEIMLKKGFPNLAGSCLIFSELLPTINPFRRSIRL